MGHAQQDGSLTLNNYDPFNQLIETTKNNIQEQYQYNAEGLRTAKISDGVRTSYMWDGDQIIMETTGLVDTKYYRGSHLIKMNDATSGDQGYLFNGHGDVVQMTGADGSVAKTYSYDAFGNQINPQADDNNPFRYCAEYFDKATGSIYLRARYYDPNTGRFTQEDPIKDGLDWYTYCANNPIYYKDPSGLIITCTEEDSETIISLLSELAGKSLEFEYKDGKIEIVKSYDTENHVGQTLVSDLINSSEIVNVNIGLDYDGKTNSEWPASGDNPMQVFIDPNNTTGTGLYKTWVQDSHGNVFEEEIPAYILFGHELVHAWRDIYGLDVPSRDMVGSIPQDAPQLWREEELQTMGINYTDADGNPMRNYSTYNGIISENGLRLENGLNVRISYYVW